MSVLAQSSSAQPSLGNLDVEKLPNNTVLPVQLVGRVVTLKNTSTLESYKCCCLSFLNKQNSELRDELITGKRIGAIHIENHKIKSLTITEEMLSILTKANITGISFIEGAKILSLDSDKPLLRKFDSEEQYLKYVAKFVKF